MTLEEIALGIAAIAIVLAAGFAVGKAVYAIIVFIAKRLTRATKSTLDDTILQYSERPLELATITLVVYALSAKLEQLAFVNKIMAQYSLAILIMITAYLISEVIGGALKWYYLEGKEKSKFKMDVTLLPLLRKVSSVVIIAAGITSSLAIVGFDVSGILAVTSVLVLVLGLASQESLANIFAGIALQLDRPFIYGEYLKFTTGEVARLKKIGLRSSKLEDLNGNTMVISNSEFAKQRLTNLSRPTPAFTTTIQVELPVETDFTKFKKHVTQAVSEAPDTKTHKKECKITIDKVSKDRITANISITVDNHEALSAAKHAVNEITLGFIQKK